MNSFKSRLLSLLIATLLILPVFVTSGCKELSNDPPESSGNMVVNLGDIQKQLSVSSTNNSSNGQSQSVTVPGSSPASDEVKSLLVGAFVVTTRDTPYTKDVPITDTVEDDLKDELSGSVDYIKIVSLPTEKDYIEFPYPKSELSKWQVIAVALNFDINQFAELGEDDHENSILYFGFSDKFYKSNTIGENELVTIDMTRACLSNNTVLGCATYNDSISGTPIVTTAVEILDVRYNDTVFSTSSVTFPILVHSAGDVAGAVSSLEQVRSEIISAYGASNITSLTVRTSHSKNTDESAACQSSTSLTDLTDNCENQLNKITLVD